jgi:hypothetical protein
MFSMTTDAKKLLPITHHVARFLKFKMADSEPEVRASRVAL